MGLVQTLSLVPRTLWLVGNTHLESSFASRHVFRPAKWLSYAVPSWNVLRVAPPIVGCHRYLPQSRVSVGRPLYFRLYIFFVSSLKFLYQFSWKRKSISMTFIRDVTLSIIICRFHAAVSWLYPHVSTGSGKYSYHFFPHTFTLTCLLILKWNSACIFSY